MPLADWVANDVSERSRVEATVEIFGDAYDELFQYHPTDPDIGECFLRLVADGNDAKLEHLGPQANPNPTLYWNQKWIELTNPLRLSLAVDNSGKEFLRSQQLLPKQLGPSNWQVTEWTINRVKVNGRLMLEENIFWRDASGREASSRYRWFPY